MSGIDQTVTTADNRVLHRKHFSKPISELKQEPNNKGTGLRGPDGRFIKSPRTHTIHDTDSESEDVPLAFMDTTTGSTPDYGKQQTTPKKTGTLGRGRPKLDRNRQNTDSPGGQHK